MCINSRIQVFNLNKISKVLSDNINSMSIKENGQTDRRTNMQAGKQEAGKQTDRQTDTPSE